MSPDTLQEHSEAYSGSEVTGVRWLRLAGGWTLHVAGMPVPYTRMTRRTVYATYTAGPKAGQPTPKAIAAQRYLAYKDGLGWSLRPFIGEPSGEPIDLEVVVWLPVGQKTRGDLDNYVKGCCDALNRVAWHDDRQVVHIEASLRRGDPGLTVTVRELPQ